MTEQRLWARFDIDMGRKYGEGGYGATFAAHDREPPPGLPPAAAVKIVDTQKMRSSALRTECEILEQLQHPNIISIRGHGHGPPGTGQEHLYFIFMECADGGELFEQVIDRAPKAMTEEVAQAYFAPLIAGVQYCHECGVAHRDLKLENVLLTTGGQLKIIDFGLSHVFPRDANGQFDRSERLTRLVGSKSYVAPQVLSGEGYDGFEADVWYVGVTAVPTLHTALPFTPFLPLPVRQYTHDPLSLLSPLTSPLHPISPLYARQCGATLPLTPLTPHPSSRRSLGVCLFAMLAGFFPLSEAHPRDWRFPLLEAAQKKGDSTTRAIFGWYKRSCSYLSPSAVDLLDRMLAVDPTRRASLQDVAAHAWMHRAGTLGAGEPADADADEMDEEERGPMFRGPALGAAAVQRLLAEEEARRAAELDPAIAPVYRALGISAHELLPMPALERQFAGSDSGRGACL
jgi:serine/threonine protein kinase